MIGYEFKEGDPVRVLMSDGVYQGRVLDRTMFTELWAKEESPAYFVTFENEPGGARWVRESSLVLDREAKDMEEHPTGALIVVLAVVSAAVVAGVVIWLLLT